MWWNCAGEMNYSSFAGMQMAKKEELNLFAVGVPCASYWKIQVCNHVG